jgi:predicted N-acetyltransferase YhbS
MRIRLASPSDAQAIHELYTRSVRWYWPSFYSDQQIAVRLSGRTPSGYLPAIERGRILVAEHGSRIVGLAHAELGIIEAVFVDPHTANLGVGSALLRRAMELAGGFPVRLTSTLNAVRFYKRHGFVVTRYSELRKDNVSMSVAIMELRGDA